MKPARREKSHNAYGINNDTVLRYIDKMQRSPTNVRFAELKHVCTALFGKPRINGSHYYFKTPWAGDPRICIQPKNGQAKAYQVHDVLAAVEKLREMEDNA